MTGAGGTRSRYALNVSLVMAEHHVTERPTMAAAAGFDQVEMWWPFTDPEPAREDLAALYASLRTTTRETAACLATRTDGNAAGAASAQRWTSPPKPGAAC
jgi:hydroxypyruvate isomerase